MKRPDGKRIDCPHAGGTESEQVAEWRKLQDELSVQNHKHHPYKRNEASENLPLAEALALVDDAAENHDEERVRADDKRNVAGGRKPEGRVLRPKVQGAPGDAADEQDEFIFPLFAAELLVACGEQNQVRDHEADGENLHGGKLVIQKHLGAHETGSPEEDCSHCYEMPVVHRAER